MDKIGSRVRRIERKKAREKDGRISSFENYDMEIYIHVLASSILFTPNFFFPNANVLTIVQFQPPPGLLYWSPGKKQKLVGMKRLTREDEDEKREGDGDGDKNNIKRTWVEKKREKPKEGCAYSP